MKGNILEPLEIDLRISGFRLTGRIDAIYPKRLIQYRYSRIKAKDRLKIWIHHLALNAAIAHNYPRISLLAGLELKVVAGLNGQHLNIRRWKTARRSLGNSLKNTGPG